MTIIANKATENKKLKRQRGPKAHHTAILANIAKALNYFATSKTLVNKNRKYSISKQKKVKWKRQRRRVRSTMNKFSKGNGRGSKFILIPKRYYPISKRQSS